MTNGKAQAARGATNQDAAVPQGPADRLWVDVDCCPLCRHPASANAVFEKVRGPDYQLRYLLCPGCGLVFQAPRMDETALETFYRKGYRTQVQGQEEPTGKDRWVQAKRAEHLLSFLAPHVHHVRRHLDIGSSLGDLLLASGRHLNCETVGIEPGEIYRQRSQERGLTVHASLSELDPALAHSFDLISLIHLVEHLPDPVGYLQGLRADWMTPNGWLLVEVPNLFGHPSLEPAHLTAFTGSTLTSTLQASGFETVKLGLHGKPHYRRLKMYVTALARPAPAGEANVVFKPQAAIRIRRRVGMGLLKAVWKALRAMRDRSQLRPWE